jgi:hypothetical protein
MSDQFEGVGSERRHTSGAPDRVLLRRFALALNLTILAFSVYVVVTKLANSDENDPAREIPLHPLTRSGVGGGVGGSVEDTAQDESGGVASEAQTGTDAITDTTTDSVPEHLPVPGTDEPRIAAEHRGAGTPGDVLPRIGDAPVDRRREPAESNSGPLDPDPAPVAPPDRDLSPEPMRDPDPADATTRERIRDAEQRIGEVGVQLEVLCNKAGSYPSSARDFGTHRGVEALFVALAAQGRADALDLGDSDGDGRMEVLDPWGRPLVYFSHDDYGTDQAWKSAGTRTVILTSVRSRARGVPQARARFQLWSAGPNGRNESGAGDDVTSWILRD